MAGKDPDTAAGIESAAPGRPEAPLILEIKGNALDDGPGIRTVVFFKGCPLNCLWCHNPESKRPDVEIGHEAVACVGCRTCLQTCLAGALSPENMFFVDRERCTLCFDCVDACPSGALRRIGRPMAVEAIVAAVVRDKPFFDNSGGGVTLSGGEPTRSPVFAGALAEALKAQGIHVLLETCGAFSLSSFRQRLYPHLDMIYYDLKLMDDAAHRRYCGVSNHTILQNFSALYQGMRQGGVPVLARVPLIPGITDTPDNLHAVAQFLRQCGADQVQLLAYHPMWREKNRTIGIAPGTDTPEALGEWLSDEKIAACHEIFNRQGINT